MHPIRQLSGEEWNLKKTFDKVCREKLWCVLDEYGVKGNLMKAIRSLWESSMC